MDFQGISSTELKEERAWDGNKVPRSATLSGNRRLGGQRRQLLRIYMREEGKTTRTRRNCDG